MESGPEGWERCSRTCGAVAALDRVEPKENQIAGRGKGGPGDGKNDCPHGHVRYQRGGSKIPKGAN